MSTSARPLSLPARLTLLILPCTYVPAGITTRSFITTGKVVCAYTGSPSRAFLVESACFSTRGTLVPAGIVKLLEAAEAVSGALGRNVAVCSAAASVASRNTMNMVRINILLKDRPKCSVGCDQNVKRLSGRRKHLPSEGHSTRRMAQPTCKSDTSAGTPGIARAARASLLRFGVGLFLA